MPQQFSLPCCMYIYRLVCWRDGPKFESKLLAKRLAYHAGLLRSVIPGYTHPIKFVMSGVATLKKMRIKITNTPPRARYTFGIFVRASASRKDLYRDKFLSILLSYSFALTYTVSISYNNNKIRGVGKRLGRVTIKPDGTKEKLVRDTMYNPWCHVKQFAWHHMNKSLFFPKLAITCLSQTRHVLLVVWHLTSKSLSVQHVILCDEESLCA